MQREHRHGGVFDHAVPNARIEHADERNMWRDLREVELIDAGADRKQEFQIAESRRDVVRRRPDRQIAHRIRIADIGPYPERQLGRACREATSPYRAAPRVTSVKERHWPQSTQLEKTNRRERPTVDEALVAVG